MSSEKTFTRENLDTYLKELGKEFRKLNGRKMPAEIVLIGGAAVLAGYGFRECTGDIDAVISASSVMKEAVNRVGDRFGLPDGWLNSDFKKTASYSSKIPEVSVYYRTFSNVLEVRMVTAQYLIAMKLMSGRQYKYDLSDIVGILWEHRKNGSPLSREMIDAAVARLYGENAGISGAALKVLDGCFSGGDLGDWYMEIRRAEKESRSVLLDYDKSHPGELKGEKIGEILQQARRKRESGGTES